MTDGGVFRLVTFLGTGDYDETRYVMADHPARSCTTRHMTHALAEILKPDEVWVCTTPMALEKNWGGLVAGFERAGLPAPNRRHIDNDLTAENAWELFGQLKDLLEIGPTGRIALDITHSWRSIPFFAGAVVSLLRATGKGAGETDVYYGSFTKGAPETPIINLSPFVALTDWSHHLGLFLQTGRAGAIADVMTETGSVVSRQWAESGKVGAAPALRSLGQKLDAFTQAFETVRTGALLRPESGLSAARLLKDAIAKARPDVAKWLPPLMDVLNELDTLVEPLCVDTLSGTAGRDALAAFAGLYLRFGRYLEAAAVMREGWVTLGTPDGLIPGNRFDVAAYAAAEARFQHDCYENQGSPPDRLRDLRNDLEHAGFRQNPNSPDQIALRSQELWQAFRISPPPSPCFANLSNHPLSDWNDVQKQAALDLHPAFTLASLVDVPFPTVPPEANEQALSELAKEAAAKVPPFATHAMVMGELTLTTLIVQQLQRRGVVCVAACGPRIAETAADGTKTSRFQFVRFRTYPPLG